MLIATGNGVCYTCHTDKAEKFKNSAFIHQPVKDLCTGCHNPHGGAYLFNFELDSSEELCFRCHTDKKEAIAKFKVKHGGLSTEKKCVACHVPHTADYAKQLMKEPKDTCLMCHDRPLGKPGKQVINMKEHLEKHKEHHGPILQNDCSGCHSTHGSNNYRILKKYYLPTFYAPFKEKNFELCFSCHEKALALDAQTTASTGFRNGEQNLHFVHVNKSDKGRTCVACHDAHATSNPKHVRDRAPFGVWGMPVGFKKTANGGSCLPGCHQTFGYDRVKPVRNRPSQGAAGPKAEPETKSKEGPSAAPEAKEKDAPKGAVEPKVEPVAAKAEPNVTAAPKVEAGAKSKDVPKAPAKDKSKVKKSGK
jgi:predicted CXXCH cytochrome family protein